MTRNGRVLFRQMRENAREQRMLEHVGEIAGVKAMAIVHAFCRSTGRGDADRAVSAAAPRELRTGVKVAKILGEADAHFLQGAASAHDAQHAGPQPRICREECALDLARAERLIL